MSLFPQPAICGASDQGGYFLDRSLRFRSSASAYLSRTFSTPTNNKKWTWSGWVKRGILSTASYSIFGQYTNSTNRSDLYFDGNDKLNFYNYVSGSVSPSPQLITSQAFRDPSAWYHIILVWDSDNATAADRQIIYVNGTRITSYQSSATVALGQSSQINSATGHTIGEFENVNVNFDGYMTEINFIDGQALDPTSFGEFDADTGVWKPLSYSGSYGTNGFYLNFNDPTSTATISQDQSGNGNDWTSNNISLTSGSTYDSMTDVPTLTGINTANYATANPLDADSSISITDGNLKATASTATHNNARTTISCGSSGYFYSELTYGSTVGGSTAFAWGLYSPTFRIDNGTHPISASSGFYGLYASASSDMYTNGSTGSSVTVSTGSAGDILQLAYDVAGGNLWFGKNNVWYDSAGGTTGNPSTGANPTITSVETDRIFGFDIVSNTLYFNFGQRPFTYTPPTGFKSLNTYNLPDSTVDNGSEYMNTVLYTGNGSTQSITGVGFQPDLVWGKSRSNVENHSVYDVVRGATKALYTNLTNAEGTDPGVSSFDSDGFSLGGSTINASGYTYAAWNWKANGSGVSNSEGDITVTVSANTTSGFSIVKGTYTGVTSSQTFGHGLGATPAMIITKDISGASNFGIWHETYGATSGNTQIMIFTSSATLSPGNYMGTVSSTLSSVSNGLIVNGNDFVQWIWTEVEGFSSFDSYTGNGSTDGPFIYTGFRPSWILVKKSSAAENWYLFDTARSTYNVVSAWLDPDLNNAEGTTLSPLDIVSNGFKFRSNNTAWNASGATYIYAAFAENPFKNSLAR